MHAKMMVRVEKISEAKNALHQAGDPATWRYGELNPVSLPVGYFLEGFTDGVPRESEPWRVDRVSRNGVIQPGVLVTSPIVSIENTGFSGGKFATQNSVYRWSMLLKFSHQ
jgi:hypothetical protein